MRQDDLSIILDRTGDGIVVIDGSGIVTMLNLSARRLLGIKDETFLGSSVSDVLPELQLHKVLTDPQERAFQFESPIVQKPSDVLTCNTFPLYNIDRELMGAAAVISDISEVESLTEQVCDLFKARKLLEAIIESTEDAISIADEHGNHIIVNPAYTRITGLTAEDVIGKPVTVDIAEGKSMHMKVLKTGKAVKNVSMKVGPKGRDVLVSVTPIIVDGKVKGSAGIIHDVSEKKRLAEELTSTRKLLRELKARYTWDDIVGTSGQVEEAKALALRAAGTPATVLLRGESGTGKELFAHAIHNASKRGDKQFIRVNCSAIVESLLEAELFGYEEGSFTGAVKGGRKGLFREAEGGTVFLDEIGELGIRLQSKLLRVLQEREVTPVGGTSAIAVDIRIIAATNANLERMVKDGTFRSDLYYRLNVLQITVVPLRDRPEDIGEIVLSMLFRLNQEYHRNVESLSDKALAALAKYKWPGNVRELINVLGRAMLNMHFTETLLDKKHLPHLGIDSTGAHGKLEQEAGTLQEILDKAEAAAIQSALERTGNNKTEAALELGISLRSLYYKMDKLKL